MKAIKVAQFGGPEVLKLEEVPDLQPAADEVVVQIKAAGVNPVDAYIRSGTYAVKPSLPYTPGWDAGGVVKTAGSAAGGFKAGDRVYIAGTSSGAYAEMALCKAGFVHRLPENNTFEQGAAVGVPYATAYQALFHRAHAAPGETVLVHGASGGVGIAAVQLARAAGMRVIGTAGSERGRKLVSAEGAHHVLDHNSPNGLEALSTLTGGRGADVIVEMLANVNLARDLKALARGGRVVVVGNRGSIEINPREAMGRDASILGMSLLNATPADLFAIHSALAAGLENGTLRPVTGESFQLAEAARAHQAVLQPGAYGKIVLIP
ncbi:MAG: NADPH:quinone reductase [Acidobacteriota bacterium]|nr:NADPH:quinone reductase [Acidobacteriota bacterium]